MESSKRQILRSTGVLAGSQIVVIAASIVRVKVGAVLLGPVGIGLVGIYQNLIDLLKSITGFSVSTGAVRDLSSSLASGDDIKTARTVVVLRRLIWVTSVFGMAATAVFSRQISQMSFGNTEHATSIATLSIALLFSNLSDGRGALLQGFQKVSDIARANTLFAVFGVALSASIYWIWGIKGIIPSLIFTYVISLSLNWYYSRKLNLPTTPLSIKHTLQESKTALSLGFFLTLNPFMLNLTMYLVRTFLNQEEGLDAVGHFVAAWSISGLYVSAIFGAMAFDYFPRLSAVQHDSQKMVKMVNEQSEISVLLAGPIIVGMISFIKMIVRIFYSKDFSETALILDWQLAGDFFKVLSWPIGFIFLAKGKGKLFLMNELFWNLAYLSSSYLGWRLFGFESIGVGFFLTYLFYLPLIYFVANRLVGFQWTAQTKKDILVFLSIISGALLSTKLASFPFNYVLGSVFTALAVYYSFHRLTTTFLGKLPFLEKFSRFFHKKV